MDVYRGELAALYRAREALFRADCRRRDARELLCTKRRQEKDKSAIRVAERNYRDARERYHVAACQVAWLERTNLYDRTVMRKF